MLRPLNPLLEPSNFILLSVGPYISWIYLRLSIAFTVIACVIMAVVNTKDRIRMLRLTLVICGAIQGVYGSLMTLSLAEWGFFVPKQHHVGSATGTFVSRNHLANYLVMCLAIGRVWF